MTLGHSRTFMLWQRYIYLKLTEAVIMQGMKILKTSIQNKTLSVWVALPNPAILFFSTPHFISPLSKGNVVVLYRHYTMSTPLCLCNVTFLSQGLQSLPFFTLYFFIITQLLYVPSSLELCQSPKTKFSVHS